MYATGLTFTGVDQRTDLDELREIARAHPMVEFAFLSSAGRKNSNRYPARGFISEGISALRKQSAVHICGSEERSNLLTGDIPDFYSAGRIQVNGVIGTAELKHLLDRGYRVITQHNDKQNPALVGLDPQTPWKHELLVDASCGNGIMPEAWGRPYTRKTVGFAGGLGPDNIVEALHTIRQQCHQGDHRWFWVDMESGVRKRGDWFDLSRVQKTIVAFESVVYSAEWQG